MKNKEFDDIIKKLFENYQADHDPLNWDSLDSRLDQDFSAQNQDFDSTFKEQFDHFIPPSADPQWDQMEQMLEKADAEDFDKELKEKVDQYEAPYNADTWPVLQNKLSFYEWMHRHVVTIKALEVVAVFFLFLSMFNFLSKKEISGTQQPQPIAQFETELPSPTRDVAVAIENLEDESSSVAPAQIKSGSTTEPFRDRLAVERGNVSLQNEGLMTQHITTSLPETLPGQFSLSGAVLQPASSFDEQILLAAVIESPDEDISRTMIDLEFLESIQQGLINGFDHSLATLVPIAEVDFPTKTKFYLSVSGAADINSLLIPRDYFFSLGQAFSFTNQTIIASGYSTGMGFTMERGKFGLETGIYYATKDYRPERVLQIGRDFDRSTLDFQNISLNIISVPAHIKYNIAPLGKWKFYAMAGVEMHVLKDARYDLITKNYFASIAPGGPDQGPSFYEEVQRVREDILDGTEFKSNSFFTANTAMGIERVLNTQFSAFFQPTYQHHLQLLSPKENNQKELKSLSFRIGVRTPIN